MNAIRQLYNYRINFALYYNFVDVIDSKRKKQIRHTQ